MGFGEQGGHPIDGAAMRASELKAELVQVAGQCCLQHASRIADLILRDYTIVKKR